MKKQNIIIVLTLAMSLLLAACGGKGSSSKSVRTGFDSTAKVTFIELGSTTCVPCQKMQPIMKSIESRYAGQVNVIFHDVAKDKPKVQQYGIKLIPTQVFLDQNGKEITRHEGFFPEAEIDKILKAQGLTPTS
jgi:thioredoxin 1